MQWVNYIHMGWQHRFTTELCIMNKTVNDATLKFKSIYYLYILYIVLYIIYIELHDCQFYMSDLSRNLKPRVSDVASQKV